MPDKTIAHQAELTLKTCFRCGITFGVPTGHMNQLIRDARPYYCPNGHRQQAMGDQQSFEMLSRVVMEAGYKRQAALETHLKDQYAAMEAELKGRAKP